MLDSAHGSKSHFASVLEEDCGGASVDCSPRASVGIGVSVDDDAAGVVCDCAGTDADTAVCAA